MSSTRLEHKMSTCLVLDICIKISHVEHSKVDIFSGRSRMLTTYSTTAAVLFAVQSYAQGSDILKMSGLQVWKWIQLPYLCYH